MFASIVPTGGDLKIDGVGIKCLECHNSYQVEDGIPLFFLPNEWDGTKKDVSNVVKDFYEKTPFPNYEEFENVEHLIQKAQKGFFARLLNEQIPLNIRVLEVGCGTGWLTEVLCDLGSVTAIDLSPRAIEIAQARGTDAKMIAGDFFQHDFPHF